MKKIMLLLSGGGDLDRAMKIALDAARKEKEVEVIPLYVIDSGVPASVSSWLIYVGFMGDKPSDDYKHTILKEYRRRAQDDLEEVEKKIKTEGFSCRTILVEGPLLDTIKKVVTAENAELLVITLPGKSEVGRTLYHDAARALKKEGTFEVKVV